MERKNLELDFVIDLLDLQRPTSNYLDMDDAELQRMRAARLAELSNQSAPSPQQQDHSTALDQTHQILSQILDSSARDRLRRIAIVKPDRASAVEQLILRMAKSGQIRQRISEDELVALLSDLSGQEQGEKAKIGGIRNLRRKDSDDEWD